MIQIDIQMPNKCCDCPCNYDGVECNITKNVLTKEERMKLFEGRPDWCPLKEVK